MASRSLGLSAPVTTATEPGCASLASARLASASKSGCSWVTTSFTADSLALRASPGDAWASVRCHRHAVGQVLDARQCQASVDNSVLDEHITGAYAAAGGTDHEQARHVAFERFRIQLGSQGLLVAIHAAAFQQH